MVLAVKQMSAVNKICADRRNDGYELSLNYILILYHNTGMLDLSHETDAAFIYDIDLYPYV